VNDSQFNQRVDDTLEAIEAALENSGADLDWDLSGGILSIECANNGSKVIINRQGPTRQIWVAARSGGYHFNYDDTDRSWRQDNLELFTLLSKALSEQCGEDVLLK